MRDGGAGGTAGVRLRTPAGIGRGLEGRFAHAMAGHGRPAGRHRRAPPEAVPACRRRDPLLPLTGITGNAQDARPSANSTARPPQGCSGRRVSGCVDQASRQNSSCQVPGTNMEVPSRNSCPCFALSASAFGLPKPLADNASNAARLSTSTEVHNLPSVPVVTTETRTSTLAASLKIATHSCARATASACLPGAIWMVRR